MDIFVVSIKASSEVNHTFAIIEANIILHNSDFTGHSSLPSFDEWESNYRNLVTDPSKFGLLKANNPKFILKQMLLLTMGEGLPLASCRDSYSLSYKDLCLLFCKAVDLIVNTSLNLQEEKYQISLEAEQVSVQANTQSDETDNRDINDQVKAQSLVISALRDELSLANDQLKEAISKGSEVAIENERKEGMIRDLTDSLDRVRAELKEFQSDAENLELSKLRIEFNQIRDRLLVASQEANESRRLSLENDFKERKIRDLTEALKRVKDEQKASDAKAKTPLNHSSGNSSHNKTKTHSGKLSLTEIIMISAVVVVSSQVLLFYFSGHLIKKDPLLPSPDTNRLNDKRFSR